MTAAAVTVVGLGSAFFTESIHAEPTTESIQNERSEIKQDLSKAESEVKDIMVEIEELNGEIKELSKKLDENKSSLEKTETNIESKESEIKDLKKDIVELEEKIEKRFDILKQRAISLQKSGGDVGYLEVIFGSQSFGDFINRVSAVSKISDSDQELIKAQEKDKKEIEEIQEQVKEKLAQLEDSKDELKSMRKTIKEQKATSDKKVSQAKSTKKELNSKIVELKIEDSELSSLQAAAERQVREATEERHNETAVASASNSDSGSQVSTMSSSSRDTGSSVSNNSSSNSSSSNNSTSKKPSNSGSAVAPPKVQGGSGIISDAHSLKGTRYQLGGTTPSAFDCSGFTSYVFKQNGISLPRTAAAQYAAFPKVSKGQLQPGDLVFFSSSPGGSNITHVAISLGGSQFIGSQSSTGVAVASINDPYYWGSRYVGAARP